MDTKNIITIVSDNSISKPGFIGEHGFSVLIEREDKKYLFDTGPGMSLPLNLKTLGKDLKGVEKIFISHGHYDHTGGLRWALKQIGKVEVVAHQAMFARHMSVRLQGKKEIKKYIGCPYTKDELERLGAVFSFSDHTKEVAPGVWFITGIDRKPEQLPLDTHLLLQREDEFIIDPIEDDSSLLLETDGPPLLLLGCSHAGVLNILDHIREEMGINKLSAILGGTHLMFFGLKEIPRVIEKFEEFSIDFIGVSHCTGIQASIELAKHFGDRFMVASAGAVFTF